MQTGYGQQTDIIRLKDLLACFSQDLKNRWGPVMCQYRVQGEITEISHLDPVHPHLWFRLKDGDSLLQCGMFKDQLPRLRFRPENGQEVIVKGQLGYYAKGGRLQLILSDIQLSGTGQLELEFRKRKERLEAMGYLDPAHHKPRPRYMEDIAVISSPEASGYKDLINTIRDRWPLARIRLYDTLVQGAYAPQQMIRALKAADMGGHDVIILCRGGGSMEDLFCFNDEELVKTIFSLQTFCVTGIGHDTDTHLADLAADYAAITPTSAGIYVTWQKDEARYRIENLVRTMGMDLKRLMQVKRVRLDRISHEQDLFRDRLLRQNMALQQMQTSWTLRLGQLIQTEKDHITALKTQPRTQLENRLHMTGDHLARLERGLQPAALASMATTRRARLGDVTRRLEMMTSIRLQNAADMVNCQKRLLEALGPVQIQEKGYAIVTKDGRPVVRAANLAAGDTVRVCFVDDCVTMKVQ